MRVHHIFTILQLVLLTSCGPTPGASKTDRWKQEILETERAFSAMSEKEGIAKAFLEYAAREAVLMRNNRLIQGREAIRRRFEEVAASPDAVTLVWEPDFVDVSTSGDLGYTYGHYTLTTTDSLGNTSQSTGVFHTVWKRQEDGAWKFVWD